MGYMLHNYPYRHYLFIITSSHRYTQSYATLPQDKKLEDHSDSHILDEFTQ